MRRRAQTLATLLVVSVWSCAPSRGTVGARFGRTEDGRLTVRDAPSGLGAAQAGLRAGDEVLYVDGLDVRALSPERLHAVLSGDVSEPVRLTVVRNDQILRLTVARSAPPPSPKPREP